MLKRIAMRANTKRDVRLGRLLARAGVVAFIGLGIVAGAYAGSRAWLPSEVSLGLFIAALVAGMFAAEACHQLGGWFEQRQRDLGAARVWRALRAGAPAPQPFTLYLRPFASTDHIGTEVDTWIGMRPVAGGPVMLAMGSDRLEFEAEVERALRSVGPLVALGRAARAHGGRTHFGQRRRVARGHRAPDGWGEPNCVAAVFAAGNHLGGQDPAVGGAIGQDNRRRPARRSRRRHSRVRPFVRVETGSEELCRVRIRAAPRRSERAALIFRRPTSAAQENPDIVGRSGLGQGVRRAGVEGHGEAEDVDLGRANGGFVRGLSSSVLSVAAMGLSSLTTYLTFFDDSYTLTAANAEVVVQVQGGGSTGANGEKSVGFRFLPEAVGHLVESRQVAVVVSDVRMFRSTRLDSCEMREGDKGVRTFISENDKTPVIPRVIEPETIVHLRFDFSTAPVRATADAQGNYDLQDDEGLWCLQWTVFDPNGTRRTVLSPSFTMKRTYVHKEGKRYPEVEVKKDYPKGAVRLVSRRPSVSPSGPLSASACGPLFSASACGPLFSASACGPLFSASASGPGVQRARGGSPITIASGAPSRSGRPRTKNVCRPHRPAWPAFDRSPAGQSSFDPAGR